MPDMEAQIDTVCARVGGDLDIIHLATPPVPPAGGVEKKSYFFCVCGRCRMYVVCAEKLDAHPGLRV